MTIPHFTRLTCEQGHQRFSGQRDGNVKVEETEEEREVKKQRRVQVG
jgi:hypothetical protein